MKNIDDILVSIVIPCYNAQNFIVATLDSVYSQNYPNIEVIVVNDGSTDNSTQLLQSYKHPLTIVNTENAGVSHARNTGFKKSSGKYVVFLDSDDLFEPRFIESRVKKLQTEKTDVVGGITVDYSKSQKSNPRKSVVTNLDISILTYDKLLNTCPSSYMIDSEKLKSSNVQFNESISCAADRLFLLDLVENSFLFSYVEIPGSEMLYRIHENSMSQVISSKLLEDLKRYFGILKLKTFRNKQLKRTALAKNDLIIAGMSYKLNNYFQSFIFLLKSFLRSPQVLLNYLKQKNNT